MNGTGASGLWLLHHPAFLMLHDEAIILVIEASFG
jgi:hypothetical protein